MYYGGFLWFITNIWKYARILSFTCYQMSSFLIILSSMPSTPFALSLHSLVLAISRISGVICTWSFVLCLFYLFILWVLWYSSCMYCPNSFPSFSSWPSILLLNFTISLPLSFRFATAFMMRKNCLGILLLITSSVSLRSYWWITYLHFLI